MQHIKVIQQCLWLTFLVIYIGHKFLAGGGGISTNYAIQVAIIVVLTALIPFYVTSRLGHLLVRIRVAIFAVLPVGLAMAGYATFYFVFIAPNFPEVAAADVIVRGITPGIVISAILLVPVITSRRSTTVESAS